MAVADPVDSNDVVTKGFMEQKTLGLDKNVWDAQKKSIQNVGTPSNMYDAVNYVTLSRESKSITDKIPKVDKVAWYFNKKRLKMLKILRMSRTQLLCVTCKCKYLNVIRQDTNLVIYH